jgi:polyribonucleotide nucleotidyltransferase
MSQVLERLVGGRTLTLETGKLAGRANGAVTVCYGDTVVLVTACMSEELREGGDFMPLTIDYEERLYAAGKIPGGFIRREGRPTQDATLVCRLTDRSLRPLFPKSMRNDVQVVVTVLSADRENVPDILAVIGASAALSVSNIPFGGPVAASRVGYINDGLVLNPIFNDLGGSLLDLIVTSTGEAVAMVEAGACGVGEDLILEAIKFGHEANLEVVRMQRELQEAAGSPKVEVISNQSAPEVEAAVSAALDDKLAQGLGIADNYQREQAMAGLRAELLNVLGDTYPRAEILSALESKVKAAMRAAILEKGVRLDGRGLRDIRPVSCDVGFLPRTHGTGLFTRGETQVLTITTLGSAGDEQRLDGISPEERKRFMHHYNFPGFSTGEVKRIGSAGRREIGHGALAERAIAPVLPTDEDFPYTIRLVSEALSSRGSTSMASVCGGSLSLMDAGVPIKAPVAGIAMGVITGEGGKYAVLTDIAGLEDAYGDMDFKVAGTAEGITALQLDIKLKGISYGIMEEALGQAREARLEILAKMRETIRSNRTELSPYAPRMYKVMVDPEKIGSIIGPGGRTIRSIIEKNDVTVDVSNDGMVRIGAQNEEAAQKTIKIIEGLTKEVEVGGTYTGKVTRIVNFGAFVEILPGKEGLVHISELADYRVPNVEDVVKVGDEIMVKVTEIDRMGRVNLSRRAVYEGHSQAGRPDVRDSGATSPPRGPQSDRDGNRPYDGNRGRMAPRPRFRDRP